MSRPTKITKYDPKKSVHENAVANGVSDAGMYYYIRTQNKSRTLAKANSIVKEIRDALKKEPRLSQAKVADITGHSVTTINKYWKAATEKRDNPIRTYRIIHEPKAFKWPDGIPEPERQGHELMSKRLNTLQSIFEYADTLDVSGLHDFLFEQPEKPMLFIGNGGMEDHFAPLLYEMNCGVAKGITPLEFASMSDATIKNSRCMLFSVGGGNMDIKYAAKRALELNPDNTACYANYISSGGAYEKFEGTTAKVFKFEIKDVNDGFISVENKFFRDAIMYRAFTGKSLSDLTIDTSSDACYRYSLNKSEGRITPLKKINHFLVLYSDFGAPAAHDFESVIAETGVASAQVTDFRNYTHGRFLMANHIKHSAKNHFLSDSDAVAVLFVTPRNKELVQSIRDIALPTKTPIVIIETEYDDARAALDLLIKSNVFLADYEEKGLGINPCDPENYNAAEIDKRLPKNNVRFAQELKRSGEMTLGFFQSSEEANAPVAVQAPSKKSLELKEKLDALIEQEHKNTEALNANPSFLPIPTKADLRNNECYDVSKHYCIAFRSKTDYWKDLWIPFGNMNGGFAYEMNGVSFPTSEQSYIFGVFSNKTEEHRKIQQEVLSAKSGYDAKRDIRKKNETKERRDWGTFNLDWMLYCVWQKVQQNAEFRELLLAIPQGVTIIEDTSFKNKPDKFWGCLNTTKKEFGKLANKYSKSLHLKTKAATERFADKLLWDYCNVGEYVGKNVMGKILTIIKDCLHKGTEPDIDYDLLKSKHIHFFGREISFRGL